MKLSIIIPTFNRAKLLAEAVKSILDCHSYIHEMIIADDGSTDETQSLCYQLQQLDSSIQIVVARSNQNLGAQVARNKGLQLTTGDAVMFMDSDDVIAEHGITPLVKQLQDDSHLDYVYGKVIQTDAHLHPLKVAAIGTTFSSVPSDIAGYHWHTMGAIYRKEYLEKVGCWNTQLTGSQDWEFQARVKLAGGQGKFIDHTVGFWRDHSHARVGTKKFRYDYVESVIKACLLIHKQAHLVGKLDAALELRLIKKLLLHTLELSINGYPLARQEYMRQALDVLHFNPSIKLVIRTLLFLASRLDPILWKTFSIKPV